MNLAWFFPRPEMFAWVKYLYLAITDKVWEYALYPD